MTFIFTLGGMKPNQKVSFDSLDGVRHHPGMKAKQYYNRVHCFLVLLCATLLLNAQEAARKPEAPNRKAGVSMKITVTSVLVNDQAKALKFYTEVLGFLKKADVPVGDDRWLTVI